MRLVSPPGEAELAGARDAVSARLAPTPLVRAPGLGEDVWLKLESLQPTGSFKVRGALSALSALPSSASVVTASAGNHGLGVAWAATALGRRATVVVPANASPAKLAALERFDVALERVGSSYDDAEEHAIGLAAAGAVYVSAYNDPRVIAGQATIGAEIDAVLGTGARFTVVAPLGGGGLASGLGLWSSARAGGRARVVAVEAERSQAFRTALDAGAVTPFTPQPTIADGLGGNLEPGSVTFPLVRDHVDAVIASPEAEIEDAIRVLASSAGVVAEGAAACAAAAVLAGRVEAEGPLVVVITGRNIARARFAEVLGG
ncbi:MAG TPA: pyridoxal-phosphate dependent enzyme [Solirubrobacteraceae bacterium]|nr:pyridoxal-phosphate dependent enzyme [Solirubrobacteraceae bacterium]